MSRRVNLIIVVLVMCCISITVQAQQRSSASTQAEISFVWGYPQGAFGDNLGRPLPGVLVSMGGKTPTLPLILSTEFGWLSYGFDDRVELVFSDASMRPSPSFFSVHTRNSFMTAHFVAQLVPYEGAVEPFVAGIVGFKYIVSDIDVESQVLLNNDNGNLIIIGDNRIQSSSAFDALALSYGVGAGVNIQVFEGDFGIKNSHTTISLHLGARYLLGSKADYLTENSILSSMDGIRFERVESDTDILISSLGFKFGF